MNTDKQTTVDEARAALLGALAGNRDAPVLDRLNDFEEAVDSAARAEAYRQGYESAVYDAEAKLAASDRLECHICGKWPQFRNWGNHIAAYPDHRALTRREPLDVERLNGLDAAWADVEATLPPHWRIEGLTLVDVSDSEDLNVTTYQWEAEASSDELFAQPRNEVGYGPDPISALRGLAFLLGAAEYTRLAKDAER